MKATEAFERSDAYDYNGPATLDFFSATGKKPLPNSPPPPPVASITFPQGVSRVTLITAPLDRDHYRMYAVPEDGDSFPAQSIRLHNFTSSRLLVAYNEGDHVELLPRTTAIIKPIAPAVVIRVARMENGKWQRLFNNVAELNDDGRQNIIFASDEGGPVRMFTLPSWPSKIKGTKSTHQSH